MATLPSGLPDAIDDEEDVARFLTSSGHYNTLTVKPNAFLPDPESQETSVSRHGKDPRRALWKIGRIAAGNRNLHGAAILKTREIRAAGLEVFSDEPPDRHAAIRNWPWIGVDAELQKAKQKEIALVLASSAGPALLVKADD